MKVYTKTDHPTCRDMHFWLYNQGIPFNRNWFNYDNDIWVFDNEEDAKKFKKEFESYLIDTDEALMLALSCEELKD